MPGATFEQRAAFLETHGNGGFRYAREVMTAMRGDERTTVTCNARADSAWLLELREIYRGRAQHLLTRGEEYELLAIEVSMLAAALEKAPVQPVRLWILSQPDGVSYNIFELVESRAIAGVVQTEDERIAQRRFFDSLGPEQPDTHCKRADCERGTIEHSVFCRAHHFESIKGMPYLGER